MLIFLFWTFLKKGVFKILCSVTLLHQSFKSHVHFGIFSGHILQSPSANVLPTLPFHVLRTLFNSTPLTTDDGVLLRRMALEIGAIHLILACLSALSHHAPRNPNSSTSVSEVSLTHIIFSRRPNWLKS